MLDERPGHDRGGARIDPPSPSQAVLPQTVTDAPSAPMKIEARTDDAVRASLMEQPGNDLSNLPVVEFASPFDSFDGTALLQGKTRVRFLGIQGPAWDDTCLDEQGARWACGLQARAGLHNLLAGRTLTCLPQRSVGPEEYTARCFLNGKPGEAAPARDIATALVELGWARPVSGPGEPLAPEANAAREKKRGLWRGGWRIYPRSD